MREVEMNWILCNGHLGRECRMMGALRSVARTVEDCHLGGKRLCLWTLFKTRTNIRNLLPLFRSYCFALQTKRDAHSIMFSVHNGYTPIFGRKF